MLNSIIFFSSFMICWMMCLIFPKCRDEMNFVCAVMLGYVTVLCYGAVGALAVQLLGLAVNINSLSIVYFAGAAILLIIVLRQKKVQSFKYRFFDFAVLFVILLIIGRIAVHIFSRRLEINYFNLIDPASHFNWAMRTVRNEAVSGMYFAALHNAMFIEMLSPFVPAVWCYKLFILADCFQALMQCWFFYGFMCYLFRDSGRKWLPAIITGLYWLGYPLYSFAGGAYIYWAMGAMLVQYVVFILCVYESNRMLRRQCFPLILLGLYSVTMCYIQFAPAIFLAAAAVYLYCAVKEGRLNINRRLAGQLGITALIALLCTLVGYRFVFYNKDISYLFEVFRMGENTSKNLEMIVMVPIIYYLVYRRYKEKEWNTLSLSLCSFMAVQFVFTVMAALNIVSSYYLFKYYFVIWALFWLIIACDYKYITGKIKKYMVNYLLAAVVFLMFLYVPSRKAETTDVYSIDNSIWRYTVNRVRSDYRNGYVSPEKVEMMEYIYNTWDAADTKVSLIGTNTIKGVISWYRGITNQQVNYFLSPLTREDIEGFLTENDVDYILIFTDSDAYETNVEYLDSFEKVYENEDGFIAKVK